MGGNHNSQIENRHKMFIFKNLLLVPCRAKLLAITFEKYYQWIPCASMSCIFVHSQSTISVHALIIRLFFYHNLILTQDFYSHLWVNSLPTQQMTESLKYTDLSRWDSSLQFIKLIVCFIYDHLVFFLYTDVKLTYYMPSIYTMSKYTIKWHLYNI